MVIIIVDCNRAAVDRNAASFSPSVTNDCVIILGSRGFQFSGTIRLTVDGEALTCGYMNARAYCQRRAVAQDQAHIAVDLYGACHSGIFLYRIPAIGKRDRRPAAGEDLSRSIFRLTVRVKVRDLFGNILKLRRDGDVGCGHGEGIDAFRQSNHMIAAVIVFHYIDGIARSRCDSQSDGITIMSGVFIHRDRTARDAGSYGDRIIVQRPLGIEGHGTAQHIRQVFYALPIRVRCAAASRRRVPAREVIACTCVGVWDQCLRRIVGETLRGHCVACAAIGVENNGVTVGRPLGVDRTAFGWHIARAAITDSLVFGKSLVNIPTAESVARPRRCGKGDAAVVRPLGIEVERPVIHLCEVADACLIVIDLRAVCARRPTVESRICHTRGFTVSARRAVVVVGHGKGAGEAVGGQGLRCTVGETLISHRAVGGAIAVEMNGIAVDHPLGVEGHGVVWYVSQVLDILPIRVRCAAATRLRVPACESITHAGVGVCSQNLRCTIAETLIIHRARGVIRVLVENNGVAVGRPLGVDRTAFGWHIARAAITDSLVFGKSLVNIPTAESVARPRRCGKGDAAVVRPLGIEVERPVIHLCEVADACLIVIDLRAVCARRPTVESRICHTRGFTVSARRAVVVVGHGKGAGEAVGGQGLRCTVGEALIIHRAASGTVAVKIDRIAVSNPLGIERAAFGWRIGRSTIADICLQGRIPVPTAEGVPRPGRRR